MDSKKLMEKKYWDTKLKRTGMDKDLPPAWAGFLSRLNHRYFKNVEY